MSAKQLTILVGALAAIIALWYFYQEKGASAPDLAYNTEVTIEGTTTCLPHKNKGGVQTMECALGIKDSQGHYYSYQLIDRFSRPDTENVRIKGLLVAPDPNSKYEYSGIIKNATMEAK
jgi:hypothetical protein